MTFGGWRGLAPQTPQQTRPVSGRSARDGDRRLGQVTPANPISKHIQHQEQQKGTGSMTTGGWGR